MRKLSDMTSASELKLATTVADLAVWDDFPWRGQVPDRFEVRFGQMEMEPEGKPKTIVDVLSIFDPETGKHVDALWQPGLEQTGPALWLLPMVVALDRAIKKAGERK